MTVDRRRVDGCAEPKRGRAEEEREDEREAARRSTCFTTSGEREAATCLRGVESDGRGAVTLVDDVAADWIEEVDACGDGR